VEANKVVNKDKPQGQDQALQFCP